MSEDFSGLTSDVKSLSNAIKIKNTNTKKLSKTVKAGAVFDSSLLLVVDKISKKNFQDYLSNDTKKKN